MESMRVMLGHTVHDAVTVNRFLQLASDLHGGLVTLQSNTETSASGGDLAVVARSLRGAVNALEQGSPGTVDAACWRVGQDVLAHFNQAQQRLSHDIGDEPIELDVGRVRAAFPPTDVQALGHRLSDLKWRLENKPDVLPSDDAAAGLPETGKSAEKVNPSSSASTLDALKIEDEQNVPKFDNADNGILQDFILDALAYSSMRDREEEVTAAHAQTFAWIFDDKRTGTDDQLDQTKTFTKWLSTNELGPIYWISGKPGSGKSTLMRFLYEHRATRLRLASWAGKTTKVSLAGFFFWTSGSQEQRSQKGLLRYLLHQLLSDNRLLIAETFLDLWQRLSKMSTKERISLTLEWTAEELMVAFQTLMVAAVRDHAICLFVDGLDEFDGSHAMIIDFFRGLAEGEQYRGRIKLCLASRPWHVFETAFQHSVPSLRLQDLTYGDMYQYTKDRLLGGERTKSLFIGRPSSLLQNVVDETVRRADGVFLWTMLVVDQMLEQFHSGEEIGRLHEILAGFPSDLDELFEKLLFSDRSSSQLAATSHLFELMHAREIVADFLKDESAHSLTVWELAFALEAAVSGIHPTGTIEIKQLSEKQIRKKVQRTQARVYENFSGLVGIYTKRSSYDPYGIEGKVTYVHRTVRDWLFGSGDIYQRLAKSSGNDFDPHLHLLQSYIFRLMFPCEEPERHRRLNDWWPDIALAMTHARYAAPHKSEAVHQSVQELDRVQSWYWVPKRWDPSDHWAKNAFSSFEIRMKAPPIERPFLCLATKFGITAYVRLETEAIVAKLSARETSTAVDDEEDGADEEEDQRKPTPPLSYAIEFLCSQMKTIYPLSDPALVEHLLSISSQLGQGPNDEYSDFIAKKLRTPWIALLRHLRDARRRGWIERYDVEPSGTARWSKIVRLFIQHGADVSAVVAADGWDPEISAIGVMDMLLETYGSWEMQRLRDEMASRLSQ